MGVEEIFLSGCILPLHRRPLESALQCRGPRTSRWDQHQQPVGQGPLHVHDVQVGEVFYGRRLEVDSRRLDRLLVLFVVTHGERAKKPLFTEERLPGRARVPQDQRVDAAATGGLVCGKQAAHPDADQTDRPDPGVGETIDCRGHATQPRLDAIGVGFGATRIAGSVVIEAKDGQAQVGQAVSQGAVGEVDADRLDAQRRTEDNPTSGHLIDRKVQPAK